MKLNYLVFTPTALKLSSPVASIDRCPLVLALMRSDSAQPVFDQVFTIRDATDLTIPTKYLGYAANSGWQYPDVDVSQRNGAISMFVAYSENKNNIWITKISTKTQANKPKKVETM